jgi:hypothetical protein
MRAFFSWSIITLTVGLDRGLCDCSRADSISKSFVNAKAKCRQYKRTASEADKVHG